MNRILLAASAVFASMLLGVNARAGIFDGIRVGAVGGLTSSETSVKSFDTKTISAYHAGVALQIPLIGKLSIQPELLYQVKGSSFNTEGGTLGGWAGSMDIKNGYLELPVQIQWGPDLLLFRPYVLAEPFLGYQLNSKVNNSELKSLESGMNRLEYGLGVGFGIELWRLQLSAKYYWNYGNLYKDGSISKDLFKEAINGGSNFNGLAFSLAVFF